MTSDFQLECNEEPEQEIPMTRKVKHKEDAQKSMPPLYFFLSIFSWKASLKKKIASGHDAAKISEASDIQMKFEKFFLCILRNQRGTLGYQGRIFCIAKRA